MKKIDTELTDIVRQWLVKAQQDLWTCEQLLKHPDAPGDIIAFHAQQTIEKCLKGLLTLRQIEFPKTHDLEELIALLRPTWEDMPVTVAQSHRLSVFAVMTRYPHEAEDLSLAEAKMAADSAREVYDSVIKFLQGQGMRIA